jgi:tetratricopeptide (TPR) repeat protein
VNPPLDSNAPISWLAELDQVAQFECKDEATTALRALGEALIEDNRTEILAQFDSAVILFARNKQWRAGMYAARRVYTVARTWEDSNSSAYSRTLAQFTFNYALEFREARVLGAAEDLLREANRLFEECSDAAGATRSEYELGRVLQERGDLNQARQCYQSSLQHAQLIADRNSVCRNLLQLGQVAHLQGDLAASVDWYSQSLAMAKETNQSLVAIAASHQLGLVAQERQDFRDATNWFDAALASAEKIGDAKSAADALHQLGMVAQAKGELARAGELYHASLIYSASLPEPAEQAPTLYQLAMCACIRAELETAKELCQQSLTLLQAQGNVQGIRRVRRLLDSIQAGSWSKQNDASVID